MDKIDPEKNCDPEKAWMTPTPDAKWICETWGYLKDCYKIVAKRWN